VSCETQIKVQGKSGYTNPKRNRVLNELFDNEKSNDISLTKVGCSELLDK